MNHVITVTFTWWNVAEVVLIYWAAGFFSAFAKSLWKAWKDDK